MIFLVLSIYDSKAGFFAPPIFVRGKGEALRGFAAIANDPTSMIGKYPCDYSIFEFGTWDDTVSGSSGFKLHSTPVSLGVAIEFVNREPSGASIESTQKNT